MSLSQDTILKLQQTIKELNKKIVETKDTIEVINDLQYERDNLLCKLMEKSTPPYFLKDKILNYKAILLYFMRNFYGNMDLDTSIINSREAKKHLFKNQKKITIQTPIDSLFHLINIPNKIIKKSHEDMIYNRLEFKNHGTNDKNFKSKIASIAWLKETLLNPDLIYDKLANKSNIGFDFLFVKETGGGEESEKYMYHLVALRDIKYNRFSIISQFAIEKDRRRSKNSSSGNISMLHTKIKCQNPIYKKDGISLPKDGINMNNLKDMWGER